MIRPKALSQFIEKLKVDFPQFLKIFITNTDGYIVCSTTKLQEDLNLFSCLTSLWEDFSVIGKLKFCKEENKDQLTPLQYQIVEFDKDKFVMILTCLQDHNQDIFIMGFYLKDKKDLGFQLQKIKVIKNMIEKEINGIVQNSNNILDDEEKDQ